MKIMEFVTWVRGMGWTQEQLLFLAAVLLGVSLLKALKRAIRRRGRDAELLLKIGHLEACLSSQYSRVTVLEDVVLCGRDNGDDDVESAEDRCLRALEADWPQHDSEVGKAAMSVLLEYVATHPGRNPEVWQGLCSKVDELISKTVAGLDENLELVKRIEISILEAVEKQTLTGVKSDLMRDVTDRLFRAVLFKTEEVVQQNPPEEMTNGIALGLRTIMKRWIVDSDDEDMRDVAERVFKSVLTRRADELASQADFFTGDVDEAIRQAVKDLLDSEDDDTDEMVRGFGRRVLQVRASALIGANSERFAEIDDILVEGVVEHIQENDIGEPLVRLANLVVRSRVNALRADPPSDLSKSVDDALIEGVDEWVADNGDAIAPSVEGLAKSIVDTQAKRLRDDPPKDTVDAVRDRIADEVEEQVDGLTDEIRSIARDVAKAAISRSTEAS